MKFSIIGKWVCLRFLVLTTSVLSILTITVTAVASQPSAHDFSIKQTAGLLELGPKGQRLASLSQTYAKICRLDRLGRQPLNKCKPSKQRLADSDQVLIGDLLRGIYVR